MAIATHAQALPPPLSLPASLSVLEAMLDLCLPSVSPFRCEVAAVLRPSQNTSSRWRRGSEEALLGVFNT